MLYHSENPNRPPEPGWVYVMESASFPGFVKVGCTTRTPAERAAELSRSSGLPLPLVVVGLPRAVFDCKAVEKAVHRMLADVRVSKDREFFACSAARALEVINAVADAYPATRQERPLPAFPVRQAPPPGQPLAKPYQVFPPVRNTLGGPVRAHFGGNGYSRRPGRSKWRNTGALRLWLTVICIAVIVGTNVLKPDLSVMPDGPVRSTLLMLEGKQKQR